MKLDYDNDDKEFNKALNRSYVLSWLNGDRVYHEGVCYVFPHGGKHIVKILKEIFSEQHTKDYHKKKSNVYDDLPSDVEPQEYKDDPQGVYEIDENGIPKWL